MAADVEASRLRFNQVTDELHDLLLVTTRANEVRDRSFFGCEQRATRGNSLFNFVPLKAHG